MKENSFIENNQTMTKKSLNNENGNNSDLNISSNLNNKNLPLLDELIESTGYSYFQYKIIFLRALRLFPEGIHLNLLSSAYIPFKNYFDLSDTIVSLISSTILISVALGSFLTLFPNIIGMRKTAILKFTFLLFIFNVLLGTIPNLYVFIILRILIGICIGVQLPLINNIAVEILPIKNRGFFMIISVIIFGLGLIFLNLILFFIMPNFEKEKFFLVCLIISFPALICGIMFYFFLEDSPRNLILNNNEEEGFKVLEQMIGKSLNEEEKDLIKIQIKSGSNKNMESKLSSIFDKRFRLITILLILIWTFNSYFSHGGNIVLSLILKHLEEINKNNTLILNKSIELSQVIKSQILVNILICPGYIIAAYMSEVKIFGRKMTIFAGFLLAGFFLTLAVLDVNNFAIYYGISSAFLILSFSGVNSYSCEVYPTIVRNQAVGFLYSCVSIVGFLSQFAAIQLFSLHYLAQSYMSILVCVVACLVTFMLPYDTHEMVLDSDPEEEEKMIKADKNISERN